MRAFMMKAMKMRTFEELSKLKTFDERFGYLRLDGEVGGETFGHERWLNQQFYRSKEWKRVRQEVIIRDTIPGNDGPCDMGLDGYPILGNVYVHHMNPITSEMIANGSRLLLTPDFLVCVSFNTHQAITYGVEEMLPQADLERRPWDTCPWRKGRL